MPLLLGSWCADVVRVRAEVVKGMEMTDSMLRADEDAEAVLGIGMLADRGGRPLIVSDIVASGDGCGSQEGMQTPSSKRRRLA